MNNCEIQDHIGVGMKLNLLGVVYDDCEDWIEVAEDGEH